MFCFYCKNERGENEAPCPHCGAPSPFTWNAHYGKKDQQPSSLPVPHQGWGMQQAGYPERQALEDALQMIPLQETARLAAVLPTQSQEHEAIYIPPIYTKPRAIIPRYRIISGFLSVLIVFALLCTGAGYYAKASGQLKRLRAISGGILPPNLPPAPTPALSDPPDRVDHGPAYLIIPSAIITAHVDPQDLFFALKSDTVFKPGQTFYVIYSVQHPKTKGIVVIKWYTNNVLYTSASSPIGAGANVTGKATMQYAKPAEGSVELDWNGQLAQKLYFVVRN
jgi:hypothetical protein